MGILQWIVKPETFGDSTAVLWNVFFVFLVATSTITTGFYIPLFWAFCCMSWHHRRAASFFRAAQEYELPLLQPEMRETGLCCGSFPLKKKYQKLLKLISETLQMQLKYFCLIFLCIHQNWQYSLILSRREFIQRADFLEVRTSWISFSFIIPSYQRTFVSTRQGHSCLLAGFLIVTTVSPQVTIHSNIHVNDDSWWCLLEHS